MGDTVASDDSNIGKEEARGHSGVVGATSTRTSGSTAEPSPRLLLLNGNDTDRATLEFRPSFHLREEWPEGVVGADGTANGRGLVVCSVDVQLLTGKTFVHLHASTFAMQGRVMVSIRILT